MRDYDEIFYVFDGTSYVNLTRYLYSFDESIEDIEAGSGRTVNGLYIKNVVKTIRKLDVVLRNLTLAESVAVMALLRSGNYLNVKYQPSDGAALITKTMFVSKFKSGYIPVNASYAVIDHEQETVDNGQAEGLIEGMSFTLEER